MAGKKARRTEKLFDAIYAGDGQHVRKLLNRGVSANARDKDGSTALYVAAVQGEPWPLGELLAAGARPNVESRGDSDGIPLCGAACWGHTATVRALLAGGADPGLAEADGMTPLAWAIGGGQRDAAWLLLDAGADPDQADAHGSTPLHRAAAAGRLSLVRLLLENGAHATRTDRDGRTPLDAAREKAGQDIEASISSYLLEHAPAGSTVEVRRTIDVHVVYPDGSPGTGAELECSHAAVAALLAARAEPR